MQVGPNYVSAPTGRQPKGIVHFVGGAFAGAAPQFAYQFLIKWLADAGFTIISTPYAVTFRHLDCAGFVHRVALVLHRHCFLSMSRVEKKLLSEIVPDLDYLSVMGCKTAHLRWSCIWEDSPRISEVAIILVRT